MLLAWMGIDERHMRNDVDEHEALLQVPIYKSTEKISNVVLFNT